MKFSFFKRKRKTKILSLDEVERELRNKIDNNEKLVESILKNNSEKINLLVEELLKELETFDPSSLPPMLSGTAKNFKSGMLKLWERNLDYESIRKNIEKMAIFKLKHYKVLFKICPKEMNRINEIISEIASAISTIESSKSSVEFDDLNAAISELNKIKSLNEMKTKLEMDRRVLIERLQDYENSAKEAIEMEVELQKMENEVKNLEEEILKREDYIKKLVATVRKVIKSFAHNAGLNINFKDFNELQSVSKNVAAEIKRGRLKVKNTQINKILSALSEIENGMPSKLKEIEMLKEELANKKLELQRLKSRIPRFDTKPIETEIESISKKIERIAKECDELKTTLERRVSKIFGFDIVLQ